jgi:Family of unknown function (DUF6689)
MRTITGVTLAVATLLGARSATAQTPFPLVISGNKAEARITLPGGISADFSIVFEDVEGLNPTALVLTAGIVNPLTLLPRLPGGGAVAVPLAFPVLIRIVPSPSSGLEFHGVATLSLHTPNLTLQLNPPLGLYSAPTGGPFREITTSTGIGSYRAGGSTGGFSDFVIAIDLRPIDVVIVEKLDRLQSLLSTHAPVIAPAVLADLQNRFAQIQSLYQSGALAEAITATTAFADAVKAASGTAIPDLWRANDSLVNVAGQLRSAAETLRYSLTLKASGTP